MDIHLWIFIVYGYPLQNVLVWISLLGYLLFTDIHCSISLYGHLYLDINVDIHTYMDN